MDINVYLVVVLKDCESIFTSFIITYISVHLYKHRKEIRDLSIQQQGIGSTLVNFESLSL
jgi:hypothetical protein